MSTVIIIPVLGRPHRVRPLLESIESATPEPHRVLFVADIDDHSEIAALQQANADYIVVNQPRNYAGKINAGYRASTEPLLLSAADDLVFHPGWLPAATALLSDTIKVVGTNDLGNARVIAGQHSTHTLFTREYIETESGVIDRPDTVLFEGYRHEYCDDEFVQTAQSRGRFAFAFASHVEHMHYAWGKAQDDETYVKGREGTRSGYRTYMRRRHLWQVDSAGTP